MKRLHIKKCSKCNKDTYHIGINKYDNSVDKDYWINKCTMCDVQSFSDEKDVIPIIYKEFHGNVYLPMSKEISLNYMKQDLFYILSVFSNSNPARGPTSKGFMDWSFFFRMPEVEIAIKNSVGPIMKVEVTNNNFNPDDFEKNLNILLSYIVEECEDREPGFVKTMLVMRSLSSEAGERIKEINSYFKNLNRNHSAYTSTISPSIIQQVMSTPTIYTSLPKTSNLTTLTYNVVKSPKRKKNIGAIV